MSFTLQIPVEAHAALTEELKKLDHVDLHSKNSPGIVRHHSGGVLEFTPTGSGEVLVNVLENPHNLPEDEIKAMVERDVKQLMLHEA